MHAYVYNNVLSHLTRMATSLSKRVSDLTSQEPVLVLRDRLLFKGREGGGATQLEEWGGGGKCSLPLQTKGGGAGKKVLAMLKEGLNKV